MQSLSLLYPQLQTRYKNKVIAVTSSHVCGIFGAKNVQVSTTAAVVADALK